MFRKIQEARENEEGFTLIELLVVVIIIGILAAIAIPVFLNQRERGWVATSESDVRNAAIGVETYLTENDSYPADDADFDANVDYIESGPVELTYVLSTTNPNAYCLTAEHDNLGDTSPDAAYSSASGGLVDNADGFSCP